MTIIAFIIIFNLNVFAKPSVIPQNTAKVEQMLKQAGLTYKRVSDTVWVVKTKGSVLPEFDMLIAENSGVLVVGVVMLNKKNLKLSPDLLFKLLKFNHEKDYVKVGVDNDDDLFVRAELNLKKLEPEEFKIVFNTVVMLADDVYTEIKPFIVTQ
jgi:hypothetical protein